MINRNTSTRNALAILALGTALAANAQQQVPGEDPVQLTAPVHHLSLPVGAAPKSGQMDGSRELPAWMKARVARYEAKSFSSSANDGTILTDNDVVNTATSQGLNKTCVQEVGSNSSAANGAGGKTQGDQIVVLRGDLINICR
ncbi:MAG: hypothetical protein ABIQ90_05520 [Polaromonas sp.]